MGVVCMLCVMCVICMDKWATALSANRTTDGATLRVYQDFLDCGVQKVGATVQSYTHFGVLYFY